MKTRWKSLLFAGILSALLPVASFGTNQPTLPANPGGGTSPSASTPENGRNDFLGAWVVGIQAGPAFSPQDLVTILQHNDYPCFGGRSLSLLQCALWDHLTLRSNP